MTHIAYRTYNGEIVGYDIEAPEIGEGYIIFKETGIIGDVSAENTAVIEVDTPSDLKLGRYIFIDNSFVETEDYKEEKINIENQRLEELSNSKRRERDNKLSATDWVVLSDVKLSDEDKQKYLDYRQALRDITSAEGFPENIVWPELVL